MLKHFSDAELACPLSGEVRLAPGFGNRLDLLRETLGEAVELNSACRSSAHNRTIRGHPRSLNLTDNQHWRCATCAVDVRIRSGAFRGRLVAAAWQLGFSIGLADAFVHIDARTRILGLSQTTYLY
jgi:hypothetical protein